MKKAIKLSAAGVLAAGLITGCAERDLTVCEPKTELAEIEASLKEMGCYAQSRKNERTQIDFKCKDIDKKSVEDLEKVEKKLNEWEEKAALVANSQCINKVQKDDLQKAVVRQEKSKASVNEAKIKKQTKVETQSNAGGEVIEQVTVQDVASDVADALGTAVENGIIDQGDVEEVIIEFQQPEADPAAETDAENSIPAAETAAQAIAEELKKRAENPKPAEEVDSESPSEDEAVKLAEQHISAAEAIEKISKLSDDKKSSKEIANSAKLNFVKQESYSELVELNSDRYKVALSTLTNVRNSQSNKLYQLLVKAGTVVTPSHRFDVVDNALSSDDPVQYLTDILVKPVNEINSSDATDEEKAKSIQAYRDSISKEGNEESLSAVVAAAKLSAEAYSSVAFKVHEQGANKKKDFINALSNALENALKQIDESQPQQEDPAE